MKQTVFIVTGRGALGGHNRSAKIIALEMARRGYDVHIVTAGTGDIYGDIDLPVKQLPVGNLGDNSILGINTFLEFKRYASQFKPNIIHVFDRTGLILSYKYARYNDVKLLQTRCGGPVGRRFDHVNMRPVIVFSDEQYHGYLKKGYYDKRDLFVSPGRVDLNFKTLDAVEIARYKTAVGIDPAQDIILMISRIYGTKAKSIKHFINLAQYMDNDRLHFLLVGMNQDSVLFDDLQNRAQEINKNVRLRRVTITEKGSVEARRLWSIAKIAVGIGRTAYESMSKGLPTLVLGEHGLSGLACGDVCDEFARFNFSGRDAQFRPEETRTEQESGKIIKKLLENQEYYQSAGESGKKWVEEHMDVRKSGELYDTMYKKDLAYFNLPSITGMSQLVLYRMLRKTYHIFRV